MPITVTAARDAAEARRTAAVLWPEVVAGQAGFSLAGLASAEALGDAWAKTVEHEADDLFVVHDGHELVGACGWHVSDAQNVQTVNGPVATRDHVAVYDALLAAMAERAPGARLLVGVSNRHERARAWLEARGARVIEHSWPFAGETAEHPLPAGVHRVAAEEQQRFREVYGRMAADDMWWTAERVCEVWDDWVVLVDEAWEALLAAMVYPKADMTEVFLAAGGDAEVLTRLGRAWLGEGARAGRREALWLAESDDEREAAAACGLTCNDEYLAYALTLGA